MSTDLSASRAADLILHGGVVHTLDSTSRAGLCGTPGGEDGGAPSTAIALADGRVLGTGDDDTVLAMAGPDTEVRDLKGSTVVPGINDSHLHATWLGAMWPRTLLGEGLESGPAVQLRDRGDQRAAILRAGQVLASLGVTSYTEPGLGPGEDDGATGAFGAAVAEEYRSLAGEGLLRARVTVLSLFGELDGPSHPDVFAKHLASEDTTSPHEEWLRFSGVKIFADGIPPMRSAYTHRCYVDGASPHLLVEGVDDSAREDALAEMIRGAYAAGRQIGVHATGDRSINLFIDAVEKAGAESSNRAVHYVIHGDLVTHGQLDRMARVGMGLNLQPGIAMATHGLVDQALGPGAAARAWPIGAALDRGVLVCLSSDAPVLAPDWRRQIADADAWMGPTRDVRSRNELLLRCYTVHPAVQDGAAAWKGTLAIGMAADLCVLQEDPLTTTPAELPQVAVELTVTGGRIVYDRQVEGAHTELQVSS